MTRSSLPRTPELRDTRLSFDQIVRGLTDRYGVPYDKAVAAAHRIAATVPITRRRGPRPKLERAPDIQAIGFRILCKEHGLPLPSTEYHFAMHLTPRRRYRFDFAFVEEKVAIEVNGGIWRKGGGAHTGTGHLRDMAKLNLAQSLGWRVLQCTPQTLCSDGTIQLVRQALLPSENRG